MFELKFANSCTGDTDSLITLGTGTSYFGGNLTAYVNNGTIPESRVDDMGTFSYLRCTDNVATQSYF
jgi:hypothetical protein